MMALRKFVEYGAASRNEVTLRVNQTLFISNSMVARYGGTGATAVNLYIDDETPRIGIEFLSPSDDNGKETRKISTEKSGIAINVSAILKYYNIPKFEGKRTLYTKNEEGMLILDLNDLLK